MSERSDILQRFDPRTKGCVLVGFSIVMFVSGSTNIVLLGIAVTLAGIITAHIPMRQVLKRQLRGGWFLCFIMMANLFSHDGEVLFEISGSYATLEGLIAGVVLSTKIIILVGMSHILNYTTPLETMIDGIDSLMSAAGKQAQVIITTLNMTLQVVPLLIQTGRRVKMAQISRGADVSSSLRAQIRFAMSATFPMFASIVRTMNHRAQAMEARCYDLSVRRTPFSRLQMRPFDWLLMLMLAGLLLIAVSIPDVF